MYTDLEAIKQDKMAKEQGPLSGFRDLLSAQMLARQKVVDVIISTYELYGFTPIKTPAIEKFETLNGKYGEEAKTLIYDFKDRGGRHIALRYDHSVPLARLMATHGQALPSTCKRYVVGDVWRGESPQAGRYREFSQIDADIVGSDSYLADCEILAMTNDIFVALDLDFKIEVNDRRILDGLVESCGITDKAQFQHLVSVIDKLAKIGKDEVLSEIHKSYGAMVEQRISKYLDVNGPDALDQILKLIDNPKSTAGVNSLKKIFETLKPLDLQGVRFNQSIARGLNYYTSIVFETVLSKLPALGSVASGGRYDELIAQLGGPDKPAVGTSIGLDRLMEGISQLGGNDEAQTKTAVYIVNLDESLDSQRLMLANQLRSSGIATEIYYSNAKLGKQLEAIDKLGVSKVIIYGLDEHHKNVVLVKDLKTSEQVEVPLEDIVSELTKDG